MTKKVGLTPEEREEELQKKLEDISHREKEREAYAIAGVVGLPYIDLEKFPVSQRAVTIIPHELATQTGAVVFKKDENNVVRVGLYIPEDEEIVKGIIAYLEDQGFTPKFYVISETSFKKVLRAYKRVLVSSKKTGEVSVSEEGLLEAQKEVESLTMLEDKLKDVPVTRVLEVILAGALSGEASDIHLEPEESDIALRYRIDGVLKEVAKLSTEAYKNIISRIKLEAGLKINITDKPQDGRISIRIKGREIDIRVSVLPTAYGETVVMRLLGVGTISLKIDDLGVREKAKKILLEQIKKPNGMVLVTGPTGSGKTTTLYACINQINSPDKKIITLENPIEYHLEGISQTQINPGKGLTFATGLKSVLRQDPDIIMVGEIRDFETADIASQAALTGHMVFSTLHTNDSSGVIPRLIDLGLRPFTIAPALTAAIAQRLVRKLCPECKEKYSPTDEEMTYLTEKLGKHMPKDKTEAVFYQSKGCTKCIDTGYKGRIGVFELFEVDHSVEQLINDRASSLEIHDTVVKEQDMITMLQDGLLRVMEGVTSFDEVRRVLD
ncbi:GspE/PulE family protein [Patescibacteria group bacterium]|nr:GspE/PulE family protein [Patescibacteria group bacterium]